MLLCLDCYGNEWHTLSFAILMTHLHTAWFYCFSEKLSKVRLILDTLIKFMMIMMMIKSFTHRQSLIQHSLVHSFILSFVCSFVLRSSFRSFIRWFIQSFILFKAVLFQELQLHFLNGHMIKSHVKMNKACAHLIRCRSKRSLDSTSCDP